MILSFRRDFDVAVHYSDGTMVIALPRYTVEALGQSHSGSYDECRDWLTARAGLLWRLFGNDVGDLLRAILR